MQIEQATIISFGSGERLTVVSTNSQKAFRIEHDENGTMREIWIRDTTDLYVLGKAIIDIACNYDNSLSPLRLTEKPV